jgi:hypothetical protein
MFWTLKWTLSIIFKWSRNKVFTFDTWRLSTTPTPTTQQISQVGNILRPLSFPPCLSVYLSLSVQLSVILSFCLSVFLLVHPSVRQSVCFFVLHLGVRQSIWPLFHLSISPYLHLSFSPTLCSFLFPMSIVF